MHNTFPTIARITPAVLKATGKTEATYADLVTALRLIEHSTAPSPDDGGGHENAYSIAIDALHRVLDESLRAESAKPVRGTHIKFRGEFHFDDGVRVIEGYLPNFADPLTAPQDAKPVAQEPLGYVDTAMLANCVAGKCLDGKFYRPHFHPAGGIDDTTGLTPLYATPQPQAAPQEPSQEPAGWYDATNWHFSEGEKRPDGGCWVPLYDRPQPQASAVAQEAVARVVEIDRDNGQVDLDIEWLPHQTYLKDGDTLYATPPASKAKDTP